MLLFVEVRVGRRGTVKIPRSVAEALGIGEGSRLLLELEGGRIVLRPVPDAVELAIKGEKIARVTLEELESTSCEEQERYLKG
ncbi:AbrB/MazE/SpoVT family DNA-binding domain-containing protein [Pyrobaculum arsenaticum]|uniref:AbrB/MazE/SpoVT family DNA-binding domain-containing protein n=1 Tax=Pyrobaculum arsenaticum TaxID=121277 RepID=A0A7L4P9C7_9CREN|nr:AbrB/MazE/SpoVT family DNA-binding domain-containing protein [Pyrobaculum arsenaticum]